MVTSLNPKVSGETVPTHGCLQDNEYRDLDARAELDTRRCFLVPVHARENTLSVCVK